MCVKCVQSRRDCMMQVCVSSRDYVMCVQSRLDYVCYSRRDLTFAFLIAETRSR